MKISIIIPTLNEAHAIAGLIAFVRRYGRERVLEIIVVDADSTDSTRELAAAAGALVIRSPVASRASQMNAGAKVARGGILYFIHADVKLVTSFADDIMLAVTDGFNAGCYRYAFNSSRILLKMNAYFTRFDALMCRGGDQTLFITRTLFIQLDGFDEYYTIMEDYDLITRIKKIGRFKVIPKKILVSARKYDNNSWLRVQVANLVAFAMFFLKRKPSYIRNTYKKMLRIR